MVFKRRDKRSALRATSDFIYPRGGWARAYRYVKHRLKRLPDPPHRIARGIFIGVVVSFTPLFGMHFIVAVLLAKLFRANMIAALLATFFGNPISFPVIAAVSLGIGHLLLGTGGDTRAHESLGEIFAGAGQNLTDNFWAMFTSDVADWSRLGVFYSEVFLPYLIGGIIPGIICGIAMYYISVPVITAYKNRRRGRLKAKLEEIKAKKAAKKADEADNHS